MDENNSIDNKRKAELNKFVKSIQEYVKEEFSSSPLEYDLLQDEKTIKRVFDRHNNFLSDLSKKIGKIEGAHIESVFMRDPVVCQMFDLKSMETMSVFYAYFLGIFEDRDLKYESEIMCLCSNYKDFDRVMERYIEQAKYSLKISCGKCGNYDEECNDESEDYNDDENSTNSLYNMIEKHPIFVKNSFLKKYRNFGALNTTCSLEDIRYRRAFVRVECKEKESLIYDAEDELIEKSFRLNRYQYGDIRIQFGIAIAGNMANLYLIKFTPKCEQDCDEENCFHENLLKTDFDGLIHLRRYHLVEVSDRITLAFYILVLTEISHQLDRKYPPHDSLMLNEITLIRNFNSENSKKYGDEEIKFSHLLNMVEKKVEYEYEMTSRKLLEQFYKLISFDNESQIGSRRAITDTVRVTNLNPRYLQYKVWLEPIGYTSEATMDRIGSSLREFKKAIICVMEATLSMHVNGFVHRNISWDNITYDYRRETYLLLDFEHIGKLCQSSCQDVKHKGFNCSHSILDAALIIKLFDDPKVTYSQYGEYSKFASGLFPSEKTCEKKEEKDEKKDENVRHSSILVIKKNNSFESAKQFCKEYEEGEKSQNQNEKIEKIRELFWKFYNENIDEFKPNLSQDDIQQRKIDSSF